MVKILGISRTVSEPLDIMGTVADLLQLEGANFDALLAINAAVAKEQVEQLTSRSINGNLCSVTLDVYDAKEPYLLPFGKVKEIVGVMALSSSHEEHPTTDYKYKLGAVKFLAPGAYRVDYMTLQTDDAALVGVAAMQAGYLFTNRDEIQGAQYDPKVLAAINALSLPYAGHF